MQDELDNFRRTNDPVEAFLTNMKDSDAKIEHESLQNIYLRFRLFCSETGCSTRNTLKLEKFDKEVSRRTGLHSESRIIDGKSVKVWCR